MISLQDTEKLPSPAGLEEALNGKRIDSDYFDD